MALILLSKKLKGIYYGDFSWFSNFSIFHFIYMLILSKMSNIIFLSASSKAIYLTSSQCYFVILKFKFKM